MDETDILLTLAEIGVALAGFASLAEIFGRRLKSTDSAEETDPLVNTIRLRGLLDAGLSTMFLGLVGVLMLQVGGPEPWVWQAAAVAGLVIVSTIGTAAFRREKLRRHLAGFNSRLSVVMFSMVVTAFFGFAFMATGLAGEYGFELYFAILCLLLFICSTMFVLVIASLMKATQLLQDWTSSDSE